MNRRQILLHRVLAVLSCALSASAQQAAPALMGKLLWTFNDRDYVHPALSPNGKLLAFAAVVVEKRCSAGQVECRSVELTEIGVRNLETGKIRILLSSAQSKGYETYAAFATNIRWKNDRVVQATIADGDVGACTISLDVLSAKRLGEDCSSADDDPDPNVLRQLKQAFPTQEDLWLDLAASNHATWSLHGTFFLVKKDDWDLQSKDWRQNLIFVRTDGTLNVLERDLNKDLNLTAGTSWQNAFVISLASSFAPTEVWGISDSAVLYRHTMTERDGFLKPVVATGSAMVFSLSSDIRAESNSLYLLNKDGKLHVLQDRAIQASASAPRGRIATLRWDESHERRIIEVRELKMPNK